MTVADRIAWHERELVELRQQQRHDLIVAISSLIGPGVVFSTRDLWQHQAISPALASALAESNIRTARQLGKRLRQWSEKADIGLSLERVGIDHNAALWVCRL